MLPCTEMGSSGGALRLSQGYPRPPLSRRGCGWLPGHPTELDAGLRNPVQSSQRLGPRCALTNIEALTLVRRAPWKGAVSQRVRILLIPTNLNAVPIQFEHLGAKRR